MTITEYVNNFLKTSGMSQTEFARRAGLSRSYITLLIRGRTSRGEPISNLSMDTYSKIAGVTGVSAADLLEITAPDGDYKPNPIDEDFGDLVKEPTIEDKILAQLKLLSEAQKDKVLAYIQGMLS